MKTFKEFVTGTESLTEAFKKSDSVTIKNAKSYDAMMKDTIQGTVIGAMGGKVMVKVGSGQLNVDPKDLMLAEDSDVEDKESLDEVDRGLDEASTKINTRTWNIHKATVANLKQELLVGPNAKFAERVVSIVKQEVTNYGWNVTCLMDDGNEIVFAIRVKELDVSMI